MLIEYDGSSYFGWQIQTNGKTVQGEIQAALAVILRKPCSITGAGRTDTGVHASGQVAHFELDKIPDLKILQRSLNGVLDQDIRIKHIEPVAADFHARYSARWRHYRYQIAHAPLALLRNQVWQFDANLDIDAMNTAAEKLIGIHDFKSFCRSLAEADSYVCHVSHARWYKQTELTVFEITANRFLHGMVRALVGTLTDVGRGKISVKEFAHIIAAKDRVQAAQSAPAQGLMLTRVEY
jgi:tRNA pseudouridine38-40 synthase